MSFLRCVVKHVPSGCEQIEGAEGRRRRTVGLAQYAVAEAELDKCWFGVCDPTEPQLCLGGLSTVGDEVGRGPTGRPALPWFPTADISA
ncbi:MAG: hypothetical protein ACI9OJ_003422 [Myxococcota bacterium]|jgi:hypothetical protein